MILENDICIVKLYVDETYTANSTDNPYHNIVLNLDNYSRMDFDKTLIIYIDLLSTTYSIALVGDYYTYDSGCAILDNEVLTILQNKTITQINVLNGSVIKRKRFDCFGCNFAIYKVDVGYVIHGEMEITMLDNEFNKMWSFMGKDIFASVSGKEPFEICKDRVKLYDFEENYYEIDFYGKCIN